MIIIHDKLLEYGGAEFVLKELIKGLRPEYIFVPCVDNLEKWETSLGCRIKTIKAFSWVNSQRKYRALYPLLAIFLSLIKINFKFKGEKLYYSSSLAKFARFKSGSSCILYSNYPFKGVLKTQDYLKDAGFIKKLVIYFFVPFMKRLEAHALKKFDKIAVISKDAESAYCENYQVQVDAVVHCPVATDELGKIDRAQPGLSRNGLIICRLYQEKGVSELLDAINMLDGYNITVIGDGPKRQEFERQFPNVLFKGFVSEDEKFECLGVADFVINPTAQEWSLTTVEANCSGIPVISIDCSALREINNCISGVSSRPNATFNLQAVSIEKALKNVEILTLAERKSALKYFSPRAFINRMEEFIDG